MSTEPTVGARLAGRVILVTGALEGIGRAVSNACAEAGATVILSSFDQSDLEPVYDHIVARGWPEPAILPLDLDQAKESHYIGAADIIGDTFGRLDGLAHCASFAPYLSRIDDYEAGDWERVIRINLTAPFLLTQACLPLLRAAESAAVVFTSDRVGRTGRAYWGAYAAAKAGVEGLMQVLAGELRNSAIRVNSIDPGPVRTTMRIALYPGEDPNTMPAPETATGAYLDLLDPLGPGSTGQAITADSFAPQSKASD